MKRLLPFCLALVLVVAASANQKNSYSGSSSGTYYDSFHYSYTLTFQLQFVSADTTAHTVTMLYASNSGTTTNTDLGGSAVAFSNDDRFRVLVGTAGSYWHVGTQMTFPYGTNYTVQPTELNTGLGVLSGLLDLGDPVTYKVTVTIPANDTAHIVRYELWQDGAYTGFSHTSGPGDGPFIGTFQPLPNDHPVEVREVTSNLVYDPATGFSYVDASTYVRTVGDGLNPVVSTGSNTSAGTASAPTASAGGLPPAPSVLPTPAPVAPTPTPAPSPSVTPVVAPAPSPQPVAPTPNDKPTSPSGTNGATKEDIENQTKTLVTALDNDAAAEVAGQGKIVDAVDTLIATHVEGVNKIYTSVDALKSTVVTTSNAELEQGNTIAQTAHKDSQALLTALNGLGDSARNISEKLTQTRTDAETAQSDTAGNQATQLDGVAAGSQNVISVMPADIQAMDVSALSHSTGDIVLGNYDVPQLAAISGAPTTLKFNIGDLWPDWRTYADFVREAFLLSLTIAFIVTQQNRFKDYYIAWWTVPEKGTKVEPSQMIIPGAGWGKQLATALWMTTALVAAVATTIALFNSHLGAILGSTTLSNVLGSAGGVVSAMVGNTSLAVAYSCVDAFFPLAASLEFVSAHYLIGWGLPAIWTASLWTAKHVQI